MLRGEGSLLEPLDLSVSRRRLRWWLAGLIGGMLVLHVVVYVGDRFDIEGETLLRRLGNVEAENTLPTWLSAVLLLIAAIGAWVAGRETRDDRAHWSGLAAVLTLLSIDEVASFHEVFSGPVREMLGVDGFLYYAWVVPAALLVVVVAVVFWRFLFRLPSSLRNRLLVAGALYVGGAIGLEIPGGLLSGTGQMDTFQYWLVTTAEEFLEMAGVAVAIDALFGHLSLWAGEIRLRLGREAVEHSQVV